MADLSGKNLKFLSGTQASLDTLRDKGGATEGAFYLTNDTHRLYIGTTEDSKVIPVPVNEGVITVANAAALPNTAEAGQFYFATAENVLCVWSKGQWVQINPDTKLGSVVTSLTEKDTDGKIEISTTVTDSGSNTDTGTYALKEGVGITLTKAADSNTITISSSNVSTQEITTEQGADDGTAKISYTTEGKKADGSSFKDTQTISIIGGNHIDTVKAGTKQITVNAKRQEVTDNRFNNENQGFSLSISQKRIKENGETDDAPEITTLAENFLDPTIKYGYDIDTDFSTVTETGTEQEVHFQNGVADLDVFTAKQTSDLIDKRITSKLAVADAMTFKGVITTGQAVPDITASRNGDTYKITGDISEADATKISTNGAAIKVGDLLIASGTEDATTGLLTSGTFIHVPSGDEYEYETRKIEHGLEITDTTDAKTLIGGIALKAGAQIALSDTDTSNTLDREITVAHGAITTTGSYANNDVETKHISKKITATNEAYGVKGTDFASTKTIPVIKDIQIDNGHITSFVLGEETVKDTDVRVNQVIQEATVITENKKAQITTSVVDESGQGTSKNGVLNLESETIKLTPSCEKDSEGNILSSTVSMDIVWGSFS